MEGWRGGGEEVEGGGRKGWRGGGGVEGWRGGGVECWAYRTARNRQPAIPRNTYRNIPQQGSTAPYRY